MRGLPMGTRSLLWGVHQFAVHPLMVAYAWFLLYGFPWDPRLWVCFLVHDWGYWGCRDMDGDQGKRHPMLGARIVGVLFGVDWERFCATHSRWLAREVGCEPSRLCAADKLASAVYPTWLYIWLGRLSGELEEYLADHAKPDDPYRLGEEHPLRVWAATVYVARQTKSKGMERWALCMWYASLCLWLEQWTYCFLEEHDGTFDREEFACANARRLRRRVCRPTEPAGGGDAVGDSQ